jgi:hypothetical protein
MVQVSPQMYPSEMSSLEPCLSTSVLLYFNKIFYLTFDQASQSLKLPSSAYLHGVVFIACFLYQNECWMRIDMFFYNSVSMRSTRVSGDSKSLKNIYWDE